MPIVTAERKDAKRLASLVSKSNKDVAELLSLNINNASKHPSVTLPKNSTIEK